MARKRSRRNTKPVSTPRAPINLKANRRASPHSKHGLLLGDDELSRERGEEFVRSVTQGGNAGDELHDEEFIEEHGGPFITTDASEEFADDIDEMNPIDAEPAGVPTVSPLRQK
jgi:hypothetical protein